MLKEGSLVMAGGVGGVGCVGERGGKHFQAYSHGRGRGYLLAYAVIWGGRGGGGWGGVTTLILHIYFLQVTSHV